MATTLLKILLTERHLQSHTAFCREYMAVARRIDPGLSSTTPGREQYQRWLSGRLKTKPHPDHCRVLERMFPGRTISDLFTAAPAAESSQAAMREERATDRREFLNMSGGVMAMTVFDRLWSEPDRMHASLDRGSVSLTRVDELRQEAERLGVQAVRVAPAEVVHEALFGFREIRKLINEKQSLSVQRQLAVCGAMLATVLGEIVFVQGQFSLARRWYGIAGRAAKEAGDRYLVDVALAGSTYLPMYAPDPRAVLDNVVPRLESPHAPSPAVAWLWAFRAKAHAMLGDRLSFERSIDRAHQALNNSTPTLLRPGIFSFLPEKLAFYEARGWVELNNAERASTAAERAISLYDFSETQEPALVRFEQASAFVQAGELAEACRIATDALSDRRTYHSVTVVARANEFDRLIGPAVSHVVRDWREVLTAVRAPQLGLMAGPEG